MGATKREFTQYQIDNEVITRRVDTTTLYDSENPVRFARTGYVDADLQDIKWTDRMDMAELLADLLYLINTQILANAEIVLQVSKDMEYNKVVDKLYRLGMRIQDATEE